MAGGLHRERDILGHVNQVAPVFEKGMKGFAHSPIIGEVINIKFKLNPFSRKQTLCVDDKLSHKLHITVCGALQNHRRLFQSLWENVVPELQVTGGNIKYEYSLMSLSRLSLTIAGPEVTL